MTGKRAARQDASAHVEEVVAAVAMAVTTAGHTAADRVAEVAAPMRSTAETARMRAVAVDQQGASSAETIVVAAEAVDDHARRTARQNKVVKRDPVDLRVPASAGAALDVLAAKTHSLILPPNQR